MLSKSESHSVESARDAETQALDELNFESTLPSETDDIMSIGSPDSQHVSSEGVTTQSVTPCTISGPAISNLMPRLHEVNVERSADTPKVTCGRKSRRSFIRSNPSSNDRSVTGPFHANLPSSCDPWDSVRSSPYLPGIRRKSFIFGEYSHATIDIGDKMEGTHSASNDISHTRLPRLLLIYILTHFISQSLSIPTHPAPLETSIWK
jgi:hypothetical protein